MTFRVIIRASAGRDLRGAALWIARRSPGAAARWSRGIRRKIDTLSTLPSRCPVADETEAIGEEIRELLYGKRQGTYRVLFQIRGDEVHVIAVRHGARGPWEP